MELFNYFSATYAIEVHDRIIEKTGGLIGLKEIGLLESPLEHVQNDVYYPYMEDKLTHIFFSINKNHAFIDGNKRSSILLAVYFMQINCFEFRVPRFIKEMENIAIQVAQNKINKNLLKKIISSILYEDDYSESLKLEMLHVIL